MDCIRERRNHPILLCQVDCTRERDRFIRCRCLKWIVSDSEGVIPFYSVKPIVFEREWTGLEFAKSQRAVENREKWRKLVVKSSVVPQ